MYRIENLKKNIIENANLECQSLVNRGGGVVDIKTKILSSKGRNLKSTGLYQIDEMVIAEILINVCEAMGANVVNTVVEKISPYI